MEHFVEGLPNNKELLCDLGNTKGVVETAIEEGVLSVEFEDVVVVEGVGQVVVDVLLVLAGSILLLALLDEAVLRRLHVNLVQVEV
jgi:hypothetical protein